MENLRHELKQKIIETLELKDIQPSDIGENDPLVGGGLGIDSIDILDLVMMIEANYSVRIDNRELGIKVFSSLNALAEYIHKKRNAKKT